MINDGKKVSELDDVDELFDTDLVHVASFGSSWKAPLQKLFNYVSSKLTKSDVGLSNVENERQYSSDNPPPYPVTSVNGQTGAVDVYQYSTDSGTLSSDVTASGTNVIALQKCGKMVICRVSVNITSGLTANTFTTIASLPSGYIPRLVVADVVMLTSTETALLSATTQGTLRIAANQTIASGSTASIRGLLVWFVE